MATPVVVSTLVPLPCIRGTLGSLSLWSARSGWLPPSLNRARCTARACRFGAKFTKVRVGSGALQECAQVESSTSGSRCGFSGRDACGICRDCNNFNDACRPLTYARLHPTPCALRPTSYTLHPPPSTLHPTSHTPRRTPYTLDPKRRMPEAVLTRASQ